MSKTAEASLVLEELGKLKEIAPHLIFAYERLMTAIEKAQQVERSLSEATAEATKREGYSSDSD